MAEKVFEKKCPVCGKESAGEFAFCNSCGSSLKEEDRQTYESEKEMVCTTCDLSFPGDRKFCAECGSPLTKATFKEEELSLVLEDDFGDEKEEKICRKCDLVYPVESHFCSECGEVLRDSSAEEDSSTLYGGVVVGESTEKEPEQVQPEPVEEKEEFAEEALEPIEEAVEEPQEIVSAETEDEIYEEEEKHCPECGETFDGESSDSKWEEISPEPMDEKGELVEEAVEPTEEALEPVEETVEKPAGVYEEVEEKNDLVGVEKPEEEAEKYQVLEEVYKPAKKGKGKKIVLGIVVLLLIALLGYGGFNMIFPREQTIRENLITLVSEGNHQKILDELLEAEPLEKETFVKLFNDTKYRELFLADLQSGGLGDFKVKRSPLSQKYKLTLKPVETRLEHTGPYAVQKAVLGTNVLLGEQVVEIPPGFYDAEVFAKAFEGNFDLHERTPYTVSSLLQGSEKIDALSAFVLCKIENGFGAVLVVDGKNAKITLPQGKVDLLASKHSKLSAVIPTPNGNIVSAPVVVKEEREQKVTFAFKGFHSGKANENDMVYVNGKEAGKVGDYKKSGGFIGPLKSDVVYTIAGSEEEYAKQIIKLKAESKKGDKPQFFKGALPESVKDAIIKCVFEGSLEIEVHINNGKSAPFPKVVKGSPLEKRLLNRIEDSKKLKDPYACLPYAMDVDLDSILVFATKGNLYAAVKEVIHYDMQYVSKVEKSSAGWHKTLFYDESKNTWFMISDKPVDSLGKNSKSLSY